jgi:hypothetical protein
MLSIAYSVSKNSLSFSFNFSFGTSSKRESLPRKYLKFLTLRATVHFDSNRPDILSTKMYLQLSSNPEYDILCTTIEYYLLLKAY